MSGALAPGALVAGRYRLGALLGEGGSSSVFEAVDEADPTAPPLALKALRFETVPSSVREEAQARLLREASTARELQHPHVVSVRDAGTDEATGVPFLVMPRAARGDLAGWIERVGPLEPSVAVRIVLQASRGLAYAHGRGVIHRDVKPSNILFAEAAAGTPGAAGPLLAQVADFGLAKAFRAASALTASGAFLGTPAYVSPEQAMNAKHVDARTDVWSLGMVLYHALTGRPAYTQAGSFLRFFVGSDPHVTAVQSLAPWVPGRIARAVHAALLRDVDARFPSVDELAWSLLLCVGYDASEAPLAAAELVPLAEGRRHAVEPLAPLPSHWSELQRF